MSACTMPCCTPQSFVVGPQSSILPSVTWAKPSIASHLIHLIGSRHASLADVARAIEPTPLRTMSAAACETCIPLGAVVLFLTGDDDAPYAPVVKDNAGTPLVAYAARALERAQSDVDILRAIENERRVMRQTAKSALRGAPPPDESLVIETTSAETTYETRAPRPTGASSSSSSAVLLAPAPIVHLVYTPIWPPPCIDLNTGNNAHPSIYTTLAGDASLLPLELRVENLDESHVIFEALDCPMCAMGNVCGGRKARVLNAPFDVRGLALRYACTRADECWPIKVGSSGATTRGFIKFYGKEGDLRYEKYLRTVSRFGFRLSRPEFLGTSPALRVARAADRDVTPSPHEANSVVLDAVDSTILVLLGARASESTLLKLGGSRSINSILVAIKPIASGDRVRAYRAPGRLALPFESTRALKDDEALYIGQVCSIKYWKELMVLGAIKTLVGLEHLPVRLSDRARDSLYDILDTVMFTPTCQLETGDRRERVNGRCFEMPIYGEHRHAHGDRTYAVSCAQHRRTGALSDKTSGTFRRFCEEVTGAAVDDAMVASCYARYVDVLRSTMAQTNTYATSSSVPKGSKRDKCVPRFIDEGIRCCVRVCIVARQSPSAAYAPDDIIDSYALSDLALVPDEANAMSHVSCTDASATPVRSSRAMCDFYDFHNAAVDQGRRRADDSTRSIARSQRHASFGQLRLATRLFLQSAYTLEHKATRGRMISQ